MTDASSLSMGLQQLIAGLDAVDHSKTRMDTKEPTDREGYRISLDGRKGARIEIHAYGMKIVALISTVAVVYLQNVLIHIRNWCSDISENFLPLAA